MQGMDEAIAYTVAIIPWEKTKIVEFQKFVQDLLLLVTLKHETLRLWAGVSDV